MAYKSADYTDPGARYQAWLAAGRPNKDDSGIDLDVRGAPLQAQANFGNTAVPNQTFQNGAFANWGQPTGGGTPGINPPSPMDTGGYGLPGAPTTRPPPPPPGLDQPGGGANSSSGTLVDPGLKTAQANPGVQTFQNGAYAGMGINTTAPGTNPPPTGGNPPPAGGTPQPGAPSARGNPPPTGGNPPAPGTGTGNPPLGGNGQPPPAGGAPQVINLQGTTGTKPAAITIPPGSDPNKLFGPWDQFTQSNGGAFFTPPYPGWTPQNSGMPAYLAAQMTWNKGDMDIGGNTPGHWEMPNASSANGFKNEKGESVWQVGGMMNDPGKYFKDPSKVYYDKDLGWVTTDRDAVDWTAAGSHSFHTGDWIKGLSVYAGGLYNVGGGLDGILSGNFFNNIGNGVAGSFGAAGGVGGNPYAPTAGGPGGGYGGGFGDGPPTGGMPGSGPGAGPGPGSGGPPTGGPGTGAGDPPPGTGTGNPPTPGGPPGGGPGSNTPTPGAPDYRDPNPIIVHPPADPGGGSPFPVIPPGGGSPGPGSGPGPGTNTQPPPGNGQPPPDNTPKPGDKPPPPPSGANESLWNRTLAFAKQLGIVGGGISAFTSIYNMLARVAGLPPIGGAGPGGSGPPGGGGPGVDIPGLLNTGLGLGLNNQLLNFYKSQMNDLYNKGDYNSQYRPGQLDKLNQFLMDPGKALDDPAYQAMRQSQLDNEDRMLAAKGFNISGNEEGDLLKFGKNLDYTHIKDTEDELRQAAQLGNPDAMARAGMQSLPFMLGMMSNRNNDLLSGLNRSGALQPISNLFNKIFGTDKPTDLDAAHLTAEQTTNLQQYGMPDPSKDPDGANAWLQKFTSGQIPVDGYTDDPGGNTPAGGNDPPAGFSSWDEYFNWLLGDSGIPGGG